MNLIFLIAVLSMDTLKVTENQAIQIALEQNQQIAAARLAVTASQYDVLASKSSFFPTVSASATYARLSYVQKMTMPVLQYLEPGPGGILIPHYTFTQMEFGKPNNYKLQLSVSYPIFTWGARINAYKASKLSSEAKEIELKIEEARVKNQVQKLYYTALMAKALYDLSVTAYSEKKTHYESVKARYDNGYASDFELLRAKVEWKNAEPSVIQAENGYKSAVEALRFAMGLPDTVWIEPVGSLQFVDYNADLDSLIDLAIHNRLDIKQLDVQIAAMERLLSAQKASDKPSIFASWQYNYERPHGFEDRWGGSWTAVLGAQFPIFDGFKTDAQVKSMELQLRSLKVMRQMAINGAVLEVKKAYRDLEAARKTIVSQKENLKLAKKMFSMAEEQYKSGFATSLDVMDAELAYLSARVNFITALAQYRSALADLELALVAGGSKTGGEVAGQNGGLQQTSSGWDMGNSRSGGSREGGNTQGAVGGQRGQTGAPAMGF